jgi:hypothetical protein
VQIGLWAAATQKSTPMYCANNYPLS